VRRRPPGGRPAAQPGLACHCRLCQRRTGIAFWAGDKFPQGAFREPGVYRSSMLLERYYCAHCGGSVALNYIERPWPKEEPGFEAALGSFDDPAPFAPEFHFGVESQLGWLHFEPSVPQHRADEDAELQAAFEASNDQGN